MTGVAAGSGETGKAWAKLTAAAVTEMTTMKFRACHVKVTPSGYSVQRGRLHDFLMAALLSVFSSSALGHGSVVDDGDGCLIRFGFYSAHFTIFQPLTSGHREFCEDIPAVTESVFVLEYRHRSLREVPIDFRIMHNTTGMGRFVRWEDIESLADIDAHTVFHQALPPQQDGVLRVLHEFDAPGEYIGVVTVPHPTEDITYRAVFPFRVGRRLTDYWPWGLAGLAMSLVVLQGIRRRNRSTL